MKKTISYLGLETKKLVYISNSRLVNCYIYTAYTDPGTGGSWSKLRWILVWVEEDPGLGWGGSWSELRRILVWVEADPGLSWGGSWSAQNKRANRSSSLFSLFVKDNIRSRRSFKESNQSDLLLPLFRSQKTSDSHEKTTLTLNGIHPAATERHTQMT